LYMCVLKASNLIPPPPQFSAFSVPVASRVLNAISTMRYESICVPQLHMCDRYYHLLTAVGSPYLAGGELFV